MNRIKIMALGGLGQVGKNCYVIEYKENIYIVDFGVLFANESQLGVDYVIPNFTYLKENQKRIRGLFITHGHEDHIGAIPFLLKNVKIDTIYAPTIAGKMIERRLKEHKLTQKIVYTNEDSTMSYPDMNISFFRQTHSIPDTLGIFFETPDGNIVVTGDFKVDFSPPGQKSPDFHKMVAMSNKGVLAMLSDSTNSEVPGFSISEGIVGKNVKDIIRGAEGRIILSTFASNMYRVQQMIEGCLENGRYIAVAGKSLDNAIKIGYQVGYINTKNKLIQMKEVHKYPEEKVAIICTGSQGEPLAALSRTATGQHQHVTLNSNDTIVFASNPIPGNNFQVGSLIDSIAKSGANVVRNSSVNQIHASGHASQEEQKLLIALFKSKYFVPVHGTFNMLLAHSQSGIKAGVPKDKNILLDNGDALYLNNNAEPEIVRNEADGRSMFVAGSNIFVSQDQNSHSQISSSGILFLSIAYNSKTKKVVSNPQITTRGFVHVNESLPLMRSLRYELINGLKKYLAENEFKQVEAQKFIENHISGYLRQKGYAMPEINSYIMVINE